MTTYLIKYLSESGRTTIVDEATDIFGLRAIRLNGVLFDDSNIVTVSGGNSMQSVSGALLDTIMSVSGASSLRDDAQDAVTLSVSGALQGQINAIVNDQAKEETTTVAGLTQRTFPVVSFVFSPDNARPDILVFKNGVKMQGSPTGVSSVGDYHKVDGQTIIFHYDVPQASKVTIRDERTGGGGGGGGSGTDLDNITTNPAPFVNGAQSVGTNTKAWSAVYLKDTMTSTIWRLEIVSGVIQAVSV